MIYQDKIYGTFEVSNTLESIIQTPTFQRLKKIHQGGALYLVQPECNQTRYDHSMGVMLLIRRLGGTEKEQIAGLIHDISHTAFSHIVDYVLENKEEDYHEDIYERILRNGQIGQVLEELGYSIDDFLELEQYPILEIDLPHLSADRIDYTLRDLFQINLITKKEIGWFIDGLTLWEGKIVAREVKYAKWFKEKFDQLINDYFQSVENCYSNSAMTVFLKKCMREGVISLADFETDDFAVIAKIENSGNHELITQLNHLKDPQNVKMPLNPVKNKKRFIDPEIILGNRLRKLSEVV